MLVDIADGHLSPGVGLLDMTDGIFSNYLQTQFLPIDLR
jgi:hypothetical protein